MRNRTHRLFWILSPTYKLAELNKEKWLSGENGAQILTDEIKKYNQYYLRITIILAFAAGFFFDQDFYKGEEGKYITGFLVMFFCWAIFFSRAFEIFKAFLDDAVEKLNKEPPTSLLRYGERLKLAFNSYIELMVGFGAVYYVLPASFFKSGAAFFHFSSIIEAIYFSGVTMATVGYGDISPANWIAQSLVVFQVFCGLTLALVSFTVYTNLALSKPNTTH